MSKLIDEVRAVVQAFMQSGELFTALDVSNKVKMTFPLTRHREIRDLVRNMYLTDMQPNGWARTQIQVTLGDGTTADAMLYHHLSDSWDLDNKYDAQKRAQGAIQASPATLPTATVAPAGVSPTSTFGWCGAPPPAPVVAAPAPPLPTRDRWAQLFDSQPSLFPRK